MTSMGLVRVEAVAAASGPDIACRRRWGQSLGVKLESCSGNGREREREKVSDKWLLISSLTPPANLA